jgi:hypothetical protein
VLTETKAPQNGTNAVYVQTARLFRPARKIVVGVLAGVHGSAFEEMNGVIQNPKISGGQDVAARGQWKPQKVIRTMGPDATARGRVPPVLDIPFAKLAGCT